MTDALQQPMSTASPGPDSRRRIGTLFAVVGFISVLLGPAIYAIALDDAFLRSSGLLAWVLMGDGLLLGAIGMLWNPRWLNKLLFGVGSLLTMAFLVVFFVGAVLPASPSLDAMGTAPDFTLKDQDGEPVTLSDEVARGPVLLVFYRGHW